ncbi:LamG domain-containing protein [Nonomuraea muscovyensis]|uniref:LamG domain-containing protein n=1 Tax=Nonomuraea muscovyensis TaxID=1124761 RepID=UPI0033D08657
MRRIASVAAAAALTLVVGPAAARPDDEVRYGGTLTDAGLVADGGRHGRHGTVLTSGGGRVVAVPAGRGEGGGAFLRFPAGRCSAAPCPQAVVRPAESGGLVPGDGDARFSFGADVRLTAEPPADAGMNVWQFGPAGPGHAQWKLQVDGGRPSCRWSDGAGAVLLTAGTYRMPVGRWHRVRCARLSRALFQIRVLDPATGEPITPPAHAAAPLGSIRPAGTALIGGKRVHSGQHDGQTDQFRGDLDEVFFTRR